MCVDTVSRVGRTAAATLDAVDAKCVLRATRRHRPLVKALRSASASTREGPAQTPETNSLRELVRLAQRHENPEDEIPIANTINRWLSKISHP